MPVAIVWGRHKNNNLRLDACSNMKSNLHVIFNLIITVAGEQPICLLLYLLCITCVNKHTNKNNSNSKCNFYHIKQSTEHCNMSHLHLLDHLVCSTKAFKDITISVGNLCTHICSYFIVIIILNSMLNTPVTAM